MSRLLSAQRRDGNEREIITALQRAGAWVGQMDKSAGFDLLVCFCGRFYVLEVKQPGEKLTTAEKKLAEIFTAQRAPYAVVRDIDDALNSIQFIL